MIIIELSVIKREYMQCIIKEVCSLLLYTLRSSSVIGPVCSGGSAGDGDGELNGNGTSSGSSALPRDQSSSVVSLGTPSLPVAPLSLMDLRISVSWLFLASESNQCDALVVISFAELQGNTKHYVDILL